MYTRANITLTGKDRRDLIDNTLKAIKTQTDRKRDTTTRQSAIINPQNLSITNPTTYGPFYFETSFTRSPFIAFGQARIDVRRDPVIIQPYVDRWLVDSGGTKGFMLGAYALIPVPEGVTQHVISWIANGRASLYKADNTYDSWNSSYNRLQANHLVAADGDLEKAE